MKIQTNTPKAHIKKAVKQYIDLLKPTYGPAGKQVLIDDGTTIKSVDDGKMVAQELELENEHENAVLKYIREVTDKTEKRVGDGTTTSGILFSKLIELLIPEDDETSFAAKTVSIPTEIKAIRKGLEEAVAHIRKNAKKLKTEKELYEVVYNSYNNQPLAKLIASVLFKVGKDGAISIEESRGMDTEVVEVEGMEIDRGYVSPYLVNKEQEVVLDKPSVLLYNSKLDSAPEMFTFVQSLLARGITNLVIVADDFSDELVTLFVINKMKGVINPLLVKAPGYGSGKTDSLKDLAMVLGASVFDPKLSKLSEATLGSCERVRSTKDSTIFLDGIGTKKDINAYVETLRTTEELSEFEEERLEKRIAVLKGGVAVIKIGAPTDQEQKTIKAKVEDAVNAGKVALQEGVVAGAGETYASITTSSKLLNEALKEPKRQLEENGKEYLDKNVLDPALVLIAALETAVSVALGLVNTGGIISLKREENTK